MLDKERVDERDRDRAQQRARHQLAPIEYVTADQLGVVILRVDSRERATGESYFDENAVRVAIVAEKAPEEQKKFFALLRSESYIKISDAYRPIVAPILFADDRKSEKAEAKTNNK